MHGPRRNGPGQLGPSEDERFCREYRIRQHEQCFQGRKRRRAELSFASCESHPRWKLVQRSNPDDAVVARQHNLRIVKACKVYHSSAHHSNRFRRSHECPRRYNETRDSPTSYNNVAGSTGRSRCGCIRRLRSTGRRWAGTGRCGTRGDGGAGAGGSR